MIIRIFATAALFTVTGLAVTAPAQAHGVIALGLPGSVAKDGVAVGYSWNFETVEAARSDAMEQCLNFMDAPESTRALCKVSGDFSGQCLAVAMDPAPGTEGFGWAIADTQDEASDAALADCIDSDGENSDACVVQAEQCDEVD